MEIKQYLFIYLIVLSCLLSSIQGYQTEMNQEDQEDQYWPHPRRILFNSIMKSNTRFDREVAYQNFSEDWSCKKACKEEKKQAKEKCKKKYSKNKDKKHECKDRVKEGIESCYDACKKVYGDDEKWYKKWFN